MDDTYHRRINHQLNVFNKPLLSCNCNKTLIERIKLTGNLQRWLLQNRKK